MAYYYIAIITVSLSVLACSASLCVDDEKINCAYYNSLFKFCKEVDKAKIVCPKYCNLCQVDGNWSPWSDWSDCDITCENGTHTRTRSCTNPEPQKGGLDCFGNEKETQPCNREPCPIHGGWSSWSTWSECSVSCDIGIQHRERMCRPSIFGDHCFGNSRDDRICIPSSCTDGGWSTWGSWGACSESCEGGFMSRNRACSDLAPSIIGKQCVGNSEQTSLCNQQACQDGGWSTWGSWGACSESCEGGIMSRNRACSNPAPSATGNQCLGNIEQVSLCNKQACQDGGWSTWDSWGVCSESCAGGIMLRNRACSNPAPSMAGKQCVGNSEQVKICNKQACPENTFPYTEHNVAFTAYSHEHSSLSTTTLLFRNTYTNYGGGYSTTTGKFTCKVGGIYHFVVTLTKYYYQNIDQLRAYLRINGSNKLMLYLNPTYDGINEVGSHMVTGAGTFHLDKNDVVDVFGIPKHFYGGYNSIFTGFLITPDQ